MLETTKCKYCWPGGAKVTVYLATIYNQMQTFTEYCCTIWYLFRWLPWIQVAVIVIFDGSSTGVSIDGLRVLHVWPPKGPLIIPHYF